jgi:dihydrofolate reductase
MGRKTWDSLPENYKPLPDRPNIIVSRNADLLEKEWYARLTAKKNTALTFFEHTLEEAIDFASVSCPYKEISSSVVERYTSKLSTKNWLIECWHQRSKELIKEIHFFQNFHFKGWNL